MGYLSLTHTLYHFIPQLFQDMFSHKRWWLNIREDISISLPNSFSPITLLIQIVSHFSYIPPSCHPFLLQQRWPSCPLHQQWLKTWEKNIHNPMKWLKLWASGSPPLVTCKKRRASSTQVWQINLPICHTEALDTMPLMRVDTVNVGPICWFKSCVLSTV